MRSSTIISALFISVGLAAPTLSIRADEECTPIAYQISDYELVTSSGSASVNFNFQSTFANASSVVDSVQNGAHCTATGSTVPNSNECDVANRRLLFDLRGPQDQAYYQITHTWTCNGYVFSTPIFDLAPFLYIYANTSYSATWLSGNAVKIEPLNCRVEGSERICTGGPMTFAPQNVRRICGTPTC
jgi:hypothetical protein